MLPATPSTSCPSRRSACTAVSSLSGRRPLTVSAWPSSARTWAMARPIPLEAPVTIAARSGMDRYPTSPCPCAASTRLAPAEPRPRRAALGRRVVDDVVDVLIEVGGELVALRLRQLAVLDRLVEPLGRLTLDRRLEAVDRLAVGRLGDVRQRFAALQLIAQLLLGQPEIAR